MSKQSQAETLVRRSRNRGTDSQIEEHVMMGGEVFSTEDGGSSDMRDIDERVPCYQNNTTLELHQQ